MDNTDTLGILKQLERGEIDTAQAEERLSAPPTIERDYVPRMEETGAPQWVRRLWLYPLIAGILIVGLGAWIIAATVHANVLWFVCGLPVVLLGALVLALAASAQSAHWLYVNIQSSRNRRHNIRFGIPFPLGLLRLGFWFARHSTPKPKAKINVSTSRMKFNAMWEDPDTFVDALERELAEGRGVTVDVDDNGERVQVYIV